MADVRGTWSGAAFGKVFAGLYDAVAEREYLARPGGFALWGTDTRRLYDSMRFLGELPDDTAVLDVPCGGGIALRALRPQQRLRYVAADISTAMLERTEQRAQRLGVRVETRIADIEHLPFTDGEFDICVSYNGFHCLPDPAAAVREVARCLRPGGRLVGTCVVREAGLRSEAVQRAFRMAGIFGPSGSLEDYGRWLRAAGLEARQLDRSGALLHFDAVKE
ncbi:class I SAM-dependent methyltransferase [Nocardia sp. XZ_19_385]|uniref:class I SAM-dependent methyltransferase n=1 Tax=Nocardia sp. XZ_19_385 TaxID=2769488 RepID=UPI00188FACBC|nr:class I SAM-dependent methyltransferase [Nocardia sp. XZ_19_385]